MNSEGLLYYKKIIKLLCGSIQLLHEYQQARQMNLEGLKYHKHSIKLVQSEHQTVWLPS